LLAALQDVGWSAAVIGALCILAGLMLGPYEIFQKERQARLWAPNVLHSQREIRADRPDWLGAREITVISNVDIAPFGLRIKTDKPLVNGSTEIVASYEESRFRFNDVAPEGFLVQRLAGIRAGQAWIIRLYGKEPFSITDIQRYDRD
jgi:hypothetical protein